MNRLEELCHQYTDLSELDIVTLSLEAQRIEETDEYQDHDVFIDVWNAFNNQALVVYHKSPKCCESLYHDKVVGEIALRKNEPGVFHTLETKLNSVGLLAETQERRLIHQRIYPILRKNKAIGVTIVESDVSEGVLKNFQGTDVQSTYDDVSATLKMFGQLDTEITDQLADAILVFDETKHLVLANRAAISLYQRVGYIGNIIGLNYENLSLDGSQFDDTVTQLQEIHHDGQFLAHSFNYLSYFFKERKFWNKNSRQLVVLIQDKTDVKSKEAEIISKSVAIREINHRIKNNLQSVISLLRIQQRRLEGEEAKKVLSESISRIMAIASTYELMSKQLEDETNLKAAIQLLVSHFVQLNEQNQEVNIALEVDPDITVDSDQVVTISIIINEILQNIVSHAYPEGQQRMGHVIIQGQVAHEIITLTITDDGVGFDLEHTRPGSLGLTIIRNYVKDKLLGRLKIESSSEGTSISFSFDQKTQH
ncbi:MAG TPA: sensor histidine kinase [Candidatus Levilactobacillus faecigallinarum]|uniref:histidine kinase n=1 Tax=Candidatus Levilactobacillus faecigallinarum TaxID=2838638 RepID=A0A9D1U540_9LACO|nr:sensor histidine kinase [Candidatus Levilactobacillus faecigallinarum]